MRAQIHLIGYNAEASDNAGFQREPRLKSRRTFQMKTFELEIIACSVEDAVAAWQGGASRLEVTVSLEQAGLTPPRHLVEAIVREVPLPARVMLRERPAFVLTGAEELSALQHAARDFVRIGVEGFVAGHVKDGNLDVEALQATIAAGGERPVTVHTAIEQTNDPISALRSLRNFPAADRALVRAGTTIEQRIGRLPDYERAIGPGKSLILGGDIKLDMLQSLVCRTSVRIFHLGRAVRTPEIPSAPVDEVKVRNAVRLLTEAWNARESNA